MSGLDDTTEPAAENTGHAQDQDEAKDAALVEEPNARGAESPLAPAQVADQTESPEPEPEAEASVPAPEPEPAATVDPVPASEPVQAATEPVQAATEPAPAAEPASAPESEPVQSAPESATVPESASAAEQAQSTPAEPHPTAPAVESAQQVSPAIGATADGGTVTPPPSTVARPKAVTDTGKIVEGIVTAVSAESVELTLDDGRPAVIHRRNFGLNDEEPSAVVSVGDRAFGAELAREDPKSRVVLSRAWALKRQAWERVVKAAADNQLLTGKVVSASKNGLVVDVGVRGFVPSSHLELAAVTDMSPYVDSELELKILEVDPRREKLVLSRRSLLLKAQRKEMQQLLSSLKTGEVRTGTVASIADYGVFVDLGGVSGLVHISELSWRRVSKPSEVVSVGDQVEVKILDVKPKKKRISLSIRQITPDPLAEIEVGAVVTGPVTRLVDFGAFVAIGEFEGLVHLSELAEYRVSTPEEIVTPGDTVGVKILSVDKKRRRIELSIRRAAEYGG